MIKKIKNILGCLGVCCVLVSLSSCDEDWWDDDWWYDGWWDDGGWNDNRRAAELIEGRWYVDYVEMLYGNCPYYESDQFNFYSNGRVDVYGDGNFRQSGRWYVDARYLYVDLGFDGRTDIVAYIDDLYRDFMSIDVKDYYDYYNNSRYYLELGR